MNYSSNGLFLYADVTQFAECPVELRVLPAAGLGKKELHFKAHQCERHLRGKLREWARYCPRADVRKAHSHLFVYYSVVLVTWDVIGRVQAPWDELPSEVRLWRTKEGNLPRKAPVPLVQYWHGQFVQAHQLPLYADIESSDGGSLQGY